MKATTTPQSSRGFWPLLTATLANLILFGSITSAAHAEVTQYSVSVLEKRPFERRNYTQGLEIQGKQLLVSAGLRGESAVRVYSWPDMALLKELPLPAQLFGEGLTQVGERIYLLTWRAKLLLVLDANTLEPIGQGSLPGEGWGITHHGTRIWFSDGSDRLFTIDTAEGGQLQVINVRREGRPVYRLNELEWIDGEIWANIYLTDEIARIDPDSGAVTGMIDLTGLLSAEDRTPETDVLNGIAKDPTTGDIWVTGKRWPWMFRIALEESPSNPHIDTQDR